MDWLKTIFFIGVTALTLLALATIGGIDLEFVELIVLGCLSVIMLITALHFTFQSEKAKKKSEVLDKIWEVLKMPSEPSNPAISSSVKSKIKEQEWYKQEKNDEINSRSYEHYRLSYNILVFIQEQQTNRLDYIVKHTLDLAEAINENIKVILGCATGITTVLAIVNLAVEGDLQKWLGTICLFGVSSLLALYAETEYHNNKSDEKFYRDIMDDILSTDEELKYIEVKSTNQQDPPETDQQTANENSERLNRSGSTETDEQPEM